MFTAEEIRRIERGLSEGKSAQAIAAEMGIPNSTFLFRLSQSGYRIVTTMTRVLQPITPVGKLELAGV